MVTRLTIRYSILIAINLLMFKTIRAQEYNSFRDTINLKYIFWSSPKYSIKSDLKFKNTNNNLTGSLKPDFKVLFKADADEYSYLKKSGNKFTIGNFAFAVPGAICLCLATTSGLDKKTRNSLIVGGSAFLIFDISIGISGYKDLKTAVNKRNKRILNN